MKRILNSCLPALGALLFCAPFASAQASFDLNIGFGGVHDSASKTGLDNLNSVNALGSCIPNSGDINCQSLPSLSGFMLGIGGDLMLWKHIGVGADVNFQPEHPNYGPLQYRQTFYDFDAIFAPLSSKRVSLRFNGGIGGARTSFALSQSGCVGTAVCTTSVTPIGNASHFQIHAAVGLQVQVKGGFFIRPEFDYHYVPGFTDQFGSKNVTEGLVWVGYNWGGH